MRPDYRPRVSFSTMPVTVVLMIVITVVYVVQQFCASSQIPFGYYFALSNEGLRHGYVWQLLTFQFLHAGLGHLVSNLIGLWFMGRFIEERLGKPSFLRCYFLSGVAGGLLQFGLTWIFPSHFVDVPVVGASAGIFGLFAAFATLEPYGQVMLFFLIPVRASYLLIGSIVVTLYFVIRPSGGNMAHAAHLGGILFGIAYIKWGMESAPAWNDWNPLRRKLRREKLLRAATIKPALLRRRPKPAEQQELQSEEFISKQVDPILDKISAHGIQSLTDRERQILQAARARMSKR